jgi:predicted nucleotidyltransferase
MRDVMNEAYVALGEFKEKYPTYEIVFASIAGSHSFGWASEKSDIDIRGCYRIPTKNFFIEDENEKLPMTIEFKSEQYDVEFQMHELQKFLKLTIQPNLNMLDAIFADVILESDDNTYDSLCKFGNSALSKAAYPHVQGMVIHMKKHRNKYNLCDPKKNLYIFRELMRGIYLFENEELINDINTLAGKMPEFLTTVNMLLRYKKDGQYLSAMEQNDVMKVEMELEKRMLNAKEYGILRERPADDLKKMVNRFILEERKKSYEKDLL